MRDDFKFKETTKKVELELEATVAEQLAKMEAYSKIKAGELANTAIKRFISQHKDFLPRDNH